MGEFSLSHWLVILVILLLFFGPSKLPGLGQSLGKAIRGFKSGLNENDTEPNAARQDQLNQNPQSTTTTSDPEKVKDSLKNT